MNETATPRTIDDLGARVASLRWHHSIDLGHGIITPGQENTRRKLARLKIPDSLAGKTVLDIGAWDGFFSFEAERRGAARVLATDSYCWGSSHEWTGRIRSGQGRRWVPRSTKCRLTSSTCHPRAWACSTSSCSSGCSTT